MEADKRNGDVSEAMIARRAFELSLTDDARTADENWALAERQLQDELAEQARRSRKS